MSLHPATSSSVDHRSIVARVGGDTTQAELSLPGAIGWAEVLKLHAIERRFPFVLAGSHLRAGWPGSCDRAST